MNQRIKMLPDSVKKKIAAGEVIEGPFSVVKELMENSIDSGATSIEVQVNESGMKRIMVRDNGSGIHRDDLPLAVAEHATSKIADIHDIEKISAYGFRGEALSSVSSVSDMTILSRREGDEGSKLISHAGAIEITEYSGAAGTTVVVENLFYNIPARKKFLKSPKYELRSIREVFLNIALPNHAVSFSLEVDKVRKITLSSVKALEERIIQVFGEDEFSSLIYGELLDLKVKICGYFSKPDRMKSSRSMQHIFINRRPVEYKYLGFLLSRAYEAVAVKGTYPAAMIFIEIDPTLVDVNIHPAKREVKLFDQRYIDSLIMQLAGSVLNREHSMSPKPVIENISPPGRPDMDSRDSAPFENLLKFSDSAATVASYPQSSGLSVRESDSYYDISDAGIKIFGIVFETYILAEYDKSLNIIDFHAAHERIIYDSLINMDEDHPAQQVLFPSELELAIDDYITAIENSETLHSLGFDMEDLSDNRILIKSVPAIFKNVDIPKFMKELITYLKEEDSPDIFKGLSHSAACHMAFRAGDILNKDEAKYLVEEIFKGGHELRCPHGRPYIYRITMDELERMFKR